MSGEKCSTVTYNRRGALILQIGSTKDQLVKMIDSLTRRSGNLIVRADNTKISLQNKLLSDILNHRQKVLLDITDGLAEKARKLDGFVVQYGASENGLEEDQRQLSNETDILKRVEEDIATISTEIENVIKIDRIMIEANQRIEEIGNILSSHGNLLNEWNAEFARIAREEVDSLRRVCKSIIGPKTGELINNCLTNMSATFKSVEGLFSSLSGAVSDCTIKDNETRTLIKNASELRSNINECMALTNASETKALLNEYLKRLENVLTELSARRLTGQARVLDDVAVNFPVLVEIDEAFAAIENEISTIRSTFKDNEVIFNKWTSMVHREHSAEFDKIVNNKDIIKSALIQSKRLDSKDAKSLLADLSRLSRGVESTLADATSKNELQKKRAYIVQGLRVVCESLGFREIDAPHHAEKEDFCSPVIQTFDTRNLGPITFRVALKGNLESSSGIVVGRCDNQFMQITDLLKEQFGIETAFKMADTGEPIKKKWEAKDLPTSAKKMSNQ